MKSGNPLLIGLCASLSILPLPSNSDELRLRVKVVSSQAVAEVNLQEEDGVSHQSLSKDAVSGVYGGALPSAALNGFSPTAKIINPYRVVVSWADSESEQIFLAFRFPVPAALDLNVYRDITTFNESDINAVDKLGSDYDSTLKKYFRSKAFHKHWRHSLQLKDHYLALRSARIWFDASTSLANRSVFRMDPDAVSVMVEYEEKSKTDKRFSERYRKYAPPRYVEGTIAQVQAAEFDFVGQIPGLIQAGRVDDAKALNSKALETLQSAPLEMRNAVARYQRITVDLLKGNQALFAR